ncbi:MAG: DNA-processing protein DprA [Epsilonproteobacteria bacterium]|nr:DNA-processing protein DprA [Campylobacterota bacterium]
MCINSIKIQKLQNTPLENKKIFYKGNLSLLEKPIVAIVGSRKPNTYAKTYTHKIAQQLSHAGVIVISGGAIGVDAIAHKAVGAENTIMVAATGLDKRYPAINKSLIEEIEQKGLVLSQFETGTPSQRYNFPLRNQLIVALADAVVVTYADLNSGSMRSVEYALKLKKPLYVLPHRLGESEGTNELLQQEKAQPIYDIESFVQKFGKVNSKKGTDPFLEYCATNPTYEEAVAKYGAKVSMEELRGTIYIRNGIVFPAL